MSKLNPATLSFGQHVRNNWASADNPERDGFFVRAVRITGRVNRGDYLEFTDKKNNFWKIANDAEADFTLLDSGSEAAK